MTKYSVENNALFYSFTLDFNKIRFSLKKKNYPWGYRFSLLRFINKEE